MHKATGSFEVLTAGEEPIAELEGGIKLTRASGTQTFTGDIAGDGSVDWLMLYRGDTSAHLVGLQRITGSVGGRRGSFVIAADGDHDGTSSRIEWVVVAGSGTGELAGIRGSGHLIAPGGRTGTYELGYELDP
jgi:Protein of unknown function (DUF3224)